MHTIKLVFLWAILGLIPSIALAQNSTNSPNTRYGYGNLADKSFISQRGMGGIGYGLRNSQMINPMNPASFSAVDSMTFMFDLGLMGQISWFQDSFGKEQKNSANLEYLAMQFPIARSFGVGVGFEPVSFVGYAYMDTISLPSENGGGLSKTNYTGSGGLSRVYAIFSYDFLQKLSVGVKLSYLFGDVIHNIQNTPITVSSSNAYITSTIDTIRAYGFLYDFGVQYHQSIGKFKILTIGAVYSPKISFGVKEMIGNPQYDPTSGLSTSQNDTIIRNMGYQMPATYGLGFTYTRLGKLTAGADVLFQQWASAKFADQTGVLNNSLKINAGAEFIPNRTSANLLNKWHYRAGLYYTSSYLKIDDAKYNEYGINLGLGIPMQNKRSFLNIALDYSIVQPSSNASMLKEQYLKLSLSYTFSESWFFKQRVQ